MTIPSAPAPPAGSVGVGQLFADAQNQTLWLGVPAGIDAHQSVLVADLVGLQEADDDTLAAANAYTDSGLAGKANTSHTHAIADVTGLTAALAAAAASMPSGCILLWSGTIITIPAGWVICDGSNGTPDLRDRFIMGSGGSFPQRTPGGSQNRTLTTNNGGAHSHGGASGAHTLTVGELPAHGHSVSITDPGHTHTLTDPGHTHTIPAAVRLPSGGNNFNTPFAGAGTISTSSETTGASVASGTTGLSASAANTGSDQSHTHPITSDSGHTHTIPSFDVLPPYYTLAYIMRL